jgi:coatomer subunit beta
LLLITEKGDTKTKIEALKKTIQMILNGEKMPSLLMTIIRFVMPVRDHTIKKMLLIFWEIVPKYNPEGKMLHEFILVCDAYRKVTVFHICIQWAPSYKANPSTMKKVVK